MGTFLASSIPLPTSRPPDLPTRKGISFKVRFLNPIKNAYFLPSFPTTLKGTNTAGRGRRGRKGRGREGSKQQAGGHRQADRHRPGGDTHTGRHTGSTQAAHRVGTHRRQQGAGQGRAIFLNDEWEDHHRRGCVCAFGRVLARYVLIVCSWPGLDLYFFDEPSRFNASWQGTRKRSSS